jgi:hypothetical protein
MHFTCHTKVNDNMEFQYYKKIKIFSRSNQVLRQTI